MTPNRTPAQAAVLSMYRARRRAGDTPMLAASTVKRHCGMRVLEGRDAAQEYRAADALAKQVLYRAMNERRAVKVG